MREHRANITLWRCGRGLSGVLGGGGGHGAGVPSWSEVLGIDDLEDNIEFQERQPGLKLAHRLVSSQRAGTVRRGCQLTHSGVGRNCDGLVRIVLVCGVINAGRLLVDVLREVEREKEP